MSDKIVKIAGKKFVKNFWAYGDKSIIFCKNGYNGIPLTNKRAILQAVAEIETNAKTRILHDFTDPYSLILQAVADFIKASGMSKKQLSDAGVKFEFFEYYGDMPHSYKYKAYTTGLTFMLVNGKVYLQEVERTGINNSKRFMIKGYKEDVLKDILAKNFINEF